MRNLVRTAMRTAAISSLSPEAIQALKTLGACISAARRRQELRKEDLAAAARLTRKTLDKVEAGDPTSSIGAYVAVLAVLGMAGRIADLASAPHDTRGLALQDERLPRRVRQPSRRPS